MFWGTRHSEYDNKHRPLDSREGPLRLNAERAGKSGRRKIDITDWDSDGLPDLLVNSTSVHWLRNLGTQDGRTYMEDEGAIGTGVLAGHTTSPTTVAWDGAAERDLLVGAEDGFFYILHRSGR